MALTIDSHVTLSDGVKMPREFVTSCRRFLVDSKAVIGRVKVDAEEKGVHATSHVLIVVCCRDLLRIQDSALEHGGAPREKWIRLSRCVQWYLSVNGVDHVSFRVRSPLDGEAGVEPLVYSSTADLQRQFYTSVLYT